MITHALVCFVTCLCSRRRLSYRCFTAPCVVQVTIDLASALATWKQACFARPKKKIPPVDHEFTRRIDYTLLGRSAGVDCSVWVCEVYSVLLKVYEK